MTRLLAPVKKNVQIAQTNMSDDLDPLFAAFADLAVARALPFPELAERLKGHCVAAATTRAEGKATDSRLSIMTGLQRRDVARLRAFAAKPARPTPLTRLVSLWRTLPDYAPGGQPVLLDRAGEAPSFDHLARLVRQDIHPRTLLDALEAAGTVRIEGDKVRLLASAYLPPGGSAEQLAYLAANVGDHLRAATANVDGAAPPFFERALHHSGLTETQVGDLQTRFAAAMMALLEELSREAEAMKREAGVEAHHRVRLGGYGFTAPEEEN